MSASPLPPNHVFAPATAPLARELYETVRTLPLVCPHGHVPVGLLADPEARFGDPAELFVIPDHYILRMLYSQGVPLEDLGVPRVDGGEVERDRRRVWRRFCEHFHLFAGTPTGLWIRKELGEVFGVDDVPAARNADALYDTLVDRLAQPAFAPRALYRSFGIETLCTTDRASDPVERHERLQREGFDVRPTFRPDAVVAIGENGWRESLAALEERAGVSISDFDAYLDAIGTRRSAFREAGAVATDHAALTPDAAPASPREVRAIFARALRGDASVDDARRFGAHMLYEMARLSADDGLVMQLHVGSYRDHNPAVAARFGKDMGADIPVPTEWTRPLKPLLDAFGNDARFRLVLFTLDETTYGRELAPLAGHYPSVLLGAPWWFFDSVKGMERYLDAVLETAGVHNLAGFNDDTRAFASIAARHDVWRRVVCNWLAGEVARGVLREVDAAAAAKALAYDRAKLTYRLRERAASG